MAGRKIKVMLVVTVAEDSEPELFEICRKATPRMLDAFIGRSSGNIATVFGLDPGAGALALKVQGIEHTYDR